MVTPQEMHFKTVELKENLTKKVGRFRKALKTSDLANYTESAYQLYQDLILPIETLIQGKDVYIVPHGIISYIPFDALLSKVAESDSYYGLSYLVHEYNISYLYNSKLMNMSYNAPNGEGYLGVVPEYKGAYKPLLYAEKEVDEITELLSGEKITGSQASEHFVRNNAGKYDIIHFASHAEVDADRAMYSRLILEEDSVHDGDLYTYELYNMDLSSSLVVLNACNTGEGRLYAADGIISLASGFQFAGCKSVFMNLWEVPDQSSSIIVTDFFKYLKGGECKRASLSQAKRDYLSQADEHTANPAFWAGGVISGDVQPIMGTSSEMIYYYFAAGFLLLLLGLYFFKK